MKSELDILNFNGHDYLLSASALPLDDHIFSHILGKNFFNLKLQVFVLIRKCGVCGVN